MDSLTKYLCTAAALASVVCLNSEGGAVWRAAGWTPPAKLSQAGLANSVMPRWKAERLALDVQITQSSANAMSPIYPASPGKELLGKPIFVAARDRHQSKKAKTAESPARQAIRLIKLPRQIYATRMVDDPRQAFAYAPERRAQPRRLIDFAHEVY
jgi:hypothetical protein